ncbi:galactose mutarotase [Pelomyxa schiedti]|nr:galactose mutarotase [Pelomyxa schiedti]
MAATAPNKQEWGTVSGAPIFLWTLTSPSSNTRALVTNYGAILVSLVPDVSPSTAPVDVVLGFATLADYIAHNGKPFLGTTVGRVCNRIAKGEFQLDGVRYVLATNSESGGVPCHLHGGNVGFDKLPWTCIRETASSVTMRLVSRDGDEGYPGELTVDVTYTVGNETSGGGRKDFLNIEYKAMAQGKATPINLTNHTYFNLHGENGGRDIMGHTLAVRGSRFAPVSADMIPTGEILPVQGTPLDFFSRPRAIGERINDASCEQLVLGNGYDHSFILDEPKAGPDAVLEDPESGLVMEVVTSEPCVHLYTGNWLDSPVGTKSSRPYTRRYALCLETQHLADSINHPTFPSTVLSPGKTFSSHTQFIFSKRQ